MQQSALRSLGIVCDYMETTLFAIVSDLRFAIRDRLRSYGNQPLTSYQFGKVHIPEYSHHNCVLTVSNTQSFCSAKSSQN